jgi:hypothetical protein
MVRLLLLDVLRDGHVEDSVARPDGPGDAREFVGEGDRSSVVAAALLDCQCPATEPIGLV